MSNPSPKYSPHRFNRSEWIQTIPSFGWLAFFFAIPTLLILVMSFKSANPYGGFGEGWSLQAWRDMGNPSYPAVTWRTVWLSVVATVVCVGMALPVGFLLGKSLPKTRATLLLLIIVPFWTNFLIRVYAWKVLLHPEGYLRQALLSLHLIDERTLLLNHEWAVLLVMVYSYLPFAILPIYAAAEKFDFALLDAARDLGASAIRSFWQIFVPGVQRGLFAALVMVLIPALGSYIIPDLVGGAASEMLGNKIAARLFVDRNWPHAAAVSVLLMAVTLFPVLFAFAQQKKESRPESPRPESAKKGAAPA
jgi:spermidine/putrescine transport system permease protein